MRRTIEVDPRQEEKKANRAIEERIVEMRSFVDRAEAEGRDLSRREALDFDEAERARDAAIARAAEMRSLHAASLEERIVSPDDDENGGGNGSQRGHIIEGRSGGLLKPSQPMAGSVETSDGRGLDARELRSFSLGAAVRGLATGDWAGADVERRALSEGTSSAGGAMIPGPVATSVIDRVRSQARVIQAGALTLAMDENTMALPRLTAGVSAAWRNENTAVAESDPTFDRVTLTTRTLAVLTRISYELFQDMTTAGADIIERELINSMAVELDRVALRGTGTAPEPRGVLNTAGVTTITNGTNGTAFSWSQVVNLLATVQAAGFDPNAIIGNPRVLKSSALLADTTGQPLVPPLFASQIPILPTRQVPITLTVGSSTDTSELYAGDWGQMVIAFRPVVKIDVQRTAGPQGMIAVKETQERYLDSMQVAVLAFLRADVAVLHSEAFAVSTGIRP